MAFRAMSALRPLRGQSDSAQYVYLPSNWLSVSWVDAFSDAAKMI